MPSRTKYWSSASTTRIGIGGGYDGDARVLQQRGGESSPLVLIVDDNEKNRKLARDVLRAAGFQTIEAGSGAEAVALAGERRPDVFLMDLGLPDMGGDEAAVALRDQAQTAGIPVVAMSSSPLARRRGALDDGRLRGLHREADHGPRIP